MKTRMEKVTEDITLTALKRVCSTTKTPPLTEKLREAFQAGWPIPGSEYPMNDAIGGAARLAGSVGQDPDTWKETMAEAWQPAVETVVAEYLKSARESFQRGEHAQGAETLTDAVRATIGHIAASRNWPHSTDDSLFRTAAALGSGAGWPQSTEEFNQALASLSKDGDYLNSALGASIGLPRSIAFGTYLEDPENAEENGLGFATVVIELAHRLAGQEPERG